ncbi:Uncharacterised protein [Candidatus Gugararchaeum adminiculabundum]|nr:Uncharacterised protein [Candidatus Gugararchaeum adminiculabundum]
MKIRRKETPANSIITATPAGAKPTPHLSPLGSPFARFDNPDDRRKIETGWKACDGKAKMHPFFNSADIDAALERGLPPGTSSRIGPKNMRYAHEVLEFMMQQCENACQYDYPEQRAHVALWFRMPDLDGGIRVRVYYPPRGETFETVELPETHALWPAVDPFDNIGTISFNKELNTLFVHMNQKVDSGSEVVILLSDWAKRTETDEGVIIPMGKSDMLIRRKNLG